MNKPEQYTSKHMQYVYCIKDILVGVCLPPFIGDSDAAIIRQFGDVISKGGTELSKHPADYVLMRIGIIDLETATLADTENAVLCHGSDFVANNGVVAHE